MKLVAYLRVSTDDKGQDPERQKEVIQAWAMANKHQVVRWVKDEGTSRRTSIFDRPAFKRVLQDAKEYAADGIVAEQVDRITGDGIGAESIVHVKLEAEYDGLKLLYASLPAGLPGWLDELQRAIFASVGRAWHEEHCRKVNSGIRRSMAAGWPNGRPGKPAKRELDRKEWAVVDELLADGKGCRSIAHRISQMRGAYEVASPEYQKARSVSENWIRKKIAGRGREGKMLQTSRLSPSKSEGPQRDGPDAEGS